MCYCGPVWGVFLLKMMGHKSKSDQKMGSTKVATTLPANSGARIDYIICLYTSSLPFPGRKMFFKMSGGQETRPFD